MLATVCTNNSMYMKQSKCYFLVYMSFDYNSLITVIYEALCVDVEQGRINGAVNETQTHSCGFVNLACLPLQQL